MSQLISPKKLYGGLIPPLFSLILLGGTLGVFTGLSSYWLGFLEGFRNTGLGLITPFIPAMTLGVAIAVGTAIITYFFGDKLIHIKDKNNIIVEDDRFEMLEGQSLPLRQIYRNVCQELHIRLHPNQSPEDYFMPNLRKFHEHEVKVQGFNGFFPTLFLTSGFLRPEETKLSPAEYAAVLQKEVAKLHLQSGLASTIVSTVANIAEILSNLSKDNPFFKVIYYSLLPLQLARVIDATLKRSHDYQAIDMLIKTGRIGAFLNATNRIHYPGQVVYGAAGPQPGVRQRKAYEPLVNLPPFTWYKHLATWIDDNEFAPDQKVRFRLFSLPFILVVKAGTLWQNLLDETPSKTHITAYIKERMNQKFTKPKKSDPKRAKWKAHYDKLGVKPTVKLQPLDTAQAQMMTKYHSYKCSKRYIHKIEDAYKPIYPADVDVTDPNPPARSTL